jgi:hypothetical protein
MGAPRTGAGHVLDLAAMLGSLAVAGLLTLRIEWGARFNAAMVIIKIAAVVLVIAAGLPHVHTANWHPFMPYGFGGVVEGAAVVFFAVFGYDTLTTAAEEARDPQRQLPRAVLLSLAISLALYITMSLVLAGLVRYDTLNNAAPVAAAFTAILISIISLKLFVYQNGLEPWPLPSKGMLPLFVRALCRRLGTVRRLDGARPSALLFVRSPAGLNRVSGFRYCHFLIMGWPAPLAGIG